MLIDSHCHLTDERYGGAKDIIASLKTDGLERVITVGYDLESSVLAARMAERHEAIYFTAGFHPSDSGKMTGGALKEIEALLSHPKCVALGEIGLDYHYEDTDKPAQKRALKAQLALAEKLSVPVVFHVREAYGDMDDVFDSLDFKPTGVMHCFSGSAEWVKKCVSRGLYISFAGPITFKNAEKFSDIIRAVPRERILAETDCPYLTPVPHRGKINYPKYVKYQVEKIAEILGITFEEAEKLTTENAYRLFVKMKRPPGISYQTKGDYE